MPHSSLNLENYFKEYHNLLISDDIFNKLIIAKDLILEMKSKGGKIFFAGNGGSAATASHAAVDFTKQAQIPAMTFTDPALVTAFSNDFGYDKWVQKAFEFYSTEKDILFCISVSGYSENLLNAAKFAKERGNKVLVCTGKTPDNPLRFLSEIDFYVDSKSYNIVENIHSIWVTSLVDSIIGKSVYEVV
jgi:D-sedoheptulose 7-phosphate isomerase